MGLCRSTTLLRGIGGIRPRSQGRVDTAKMVLRENVLHYIISRVKSDTAKMVLRERRIAMSYLTLRVFYSTLSRLHHSIHRNYDATVSTLHSAKCLLLRD